MKTQKYFHYTALSSSILTLCLIALGGFVKNTGSSLACPDWPLCFGQVLPKMEGGVAIEHSHRLLASLVGFLNIILFYFGWKLKATLPKVFKVTCIALFVVILQGVLGGITVLMQISPLVSTFHLAISQIYFGLLIYLTLRSHPTFNSLIKSVPTPSSKIIKLLSLTLGLLYVQILLGAAIRHTGAGAACGLGHKYSLLCMDAFTGGLTFWPDQFQSQFHVFHRYFGIIMAFIIVAGTLPLLKWAKAHGLKFVRKLVVASHAVVFLQILLGLYTVMSHIGTLATTLHLFFAAFLFALLVMMNVIARTK